MPNANDTLPNEFDANAQVEKGLRTIVCFVELDAVLGSMHIATMRKCYGKIGIIHQIAKANPTITDRKQLMKLAIEESDRCVVSTCWSAANAIEALRQAAPGRQFRVYQLGHRVC